MLAVSRSDGYLGHVRCSSHSQILVRNGVFGGYGRALTQNDSRTPRKLVDEDRTAVGRVRMQVGHDAVVSMKSVKAPALKEQRRRHLDCF